MRLALPSLLAAAFLPVLPTLGAAPSAPLAPRHQAVLDLGPVGYWPADDGAGERLRDLTPRANHGHLQHVPWADGLLDFTAAYQWGEIPASPAYQTPAFSLGGWFYARTAFEGGGWPNTGGMHFFGHADWLARFGIQLYVRKQEVIDVASQGRLDALGTRRWDAATSRSLGEPVLALGRWHHLLYTFEPAPSATRPPASPDLAREARPSASDGSDPAPLLDGDPATAWRPAAPGTSVRLEFTAPRTLNLLRPLSHRRRLHRRTTTTIISRIGVLFQAMLVHSYPLVLVGSTRWQSSTTSSTSRKLYQQPFGTSLSKT